MPLRRIKTLYCVTVMAVAVLLFAAGGIIYWAASIVLLAGALPIFRLIRRVVSDERFDEAESILLAEQRRRRAPHE